MLILNLVVAVALHSPQTDSALGAVVSIQTPAQSVSRALEDLSRKSGAALSATSPVNGDILVVDVNKVRLDQLMGKIADATDASWRKTANGYVLARDVADAKRAEARSEHERTAEIERAQQALRKTLTPFPFDSQASETAAGTIRQYASLLQTRQFQALDGMSSAFNSALPLARTAERIIAEASAADFAKLPAGVRYVYCSDPNPRQYPFPTSIAKIVDQGLEDYRKLLRTVDLPPGSYHSPIASPEVRVVSELDAFSRRSLSDQKWKTYVGVRRFMRCGLSTKLIQIDIRLVDQNGKIFGGSQSQLQAVDAPAPSQDDTGIQLSPPAAALAFYAANFQKQNYWEGVPPLEDAPGVQELRAKLCGDPEVEPLSLLPGEPLADIAESRHENLVADLCDASLLAFIVPPKADGRQKNLLSLLRDRGATDVVESGGWLVCSPADPFYSETIRTDRALLAEAIRSVNATSVVREPLLELMVRHIPPGLDEIPGRNFRRITMSAAVRKANQGVEEETATYQFLGSLDMNAKEALQKGAKPVLRIQTEDELASLANILSSGSVVPWVPDPLHPDALMQEQSIYTAEPTEFLQLQPPSIAVQRKFRQKFNLVGIVKPRGFPEIGGPNDFPILPPGAMAQGVLRFDMSYTISLPNTPDITFDITTYSPIGDPVATVEKLPQEWLTMSATAD